MKKEANESSQKEIEIQKKKSLNYSLKDGTAASIDSNIQATYLPQFALALNSSSFQIGLMSAFSGILSPLAQLIGDKLIESHSRKKIIIVFNTLQAILLILMAILAFGFGKNLLQNSSVYILISLYILLTIFAGIAYSPWFSLIGDLVPKNEKGKFFSKRNIILTLAGLVIIPFGLALDSIETAGYLMLGFAIIFTISSIARTISVYFINKHYEPKFKLKKGYYFSIFEFVKRFDNVGKFAVYYALFNLALMLASPFFAVYMKQELHFNYLQITIISLASSIFYILFSPLIGKISDKYGNIKLLYVSTVLFALNPLLWLISNSFWSITLIPQLVTGLANAAMGISVGNFIFNMTKQEHRALCITYLNILAGIGTFLGSIIGGLILKFLPSEVMINPFVAIFIISALARFAVARGLVRKLKEDEDNIKPIPSIKIDFLHPIKTLSSEIQLIKKIAH
ncbi:MAG: MFS transporter [Nanoarchaeota archaeon]